MTHDVTYVYTTSTISQALEIMKNHKIGGLPVVDLDKRVRAILSRGGLPDSLIQEHYQTMKAYLEDLIGHPERISETHELEMTSRTVTIGFKPRENRS